MSNMPLKVLIVEDTPNKKAKLFEHLRDLPDLFVEPEVCISTTDASRRMQDTAYDLVILDINLPLRSTELDKTSEQHSMDLLTKIDAGVAGIKKPRHVLPMSSADSLSQEARDFFRTRPWGWIQYSDDSAQSLVDVENIARWIQAEKNLISTSRCDVFIITALEDPEFSAIESALGGLGPLQPLDSTQLVRFCDLVTNGGEVKVGIGFAPRMGPVASAVLTTKVIEKLRPSLILMAGICAGISSKAALGDLVAAEASWDWQSGKYVQKPGKRDFEIAPHQLNIDPEIRPLLIRFKRETTFWEGFDDEAAAHKLTRPKLVIGPVATGASVIADDNITAKIKEEQNKNVVGLDMETYAVYAAAKSVEYSVAVLSLKSVCDKGDRRKGDKYQTYAAKISAVATCRFLQNYGSELIALSGRRRGE